MWRIRYKNSDGLTQTVLIKAVSISQAMEIYEDNYNEDILSIEHDPNIEVIL